MSDSDAMSAAAVEVIQLQRSLISEMRLRERTEKFLSHRKRERDLAEKECEDLKAIIAKLEQKVKDKQNAFDFATSSLSEDVKAAEAKWRDLEIKRQALLTENQKLRALVPLMKADKKGRPRRCINCGKGKGDRQYTCTDCFDIYHRDDDGAAKWHVLTAAWQQGARDFPRI